MNLAYNQVTTPAPLTLSSSASISPVGQPHPSIFAGRLNDQSADNIRGLEVLDDNYQQNYSRINYYPPQGINKTASKPVDRGRNLGPAIMGFDEIFKYYFYMVSIPTIITLGVFGNLCIIVVCSLQHTNSTGYKYIMFLAVSDLLACVMMIPWPLLHMVASSKRWDLNYRHGWNFFLAHISFVLVNGMMKASTLVTCALTWDRYMALNFPLNYKKFSSMPIISTIISMCFFLSFALMLPRTMRFQVRPMPTTNSTEDSLFRYIHAGLPYDKSAVNTTSVMFESDPYTTNTNIKLTMSTTTNTWARSNGPQKYYFTLNHHYKDQPIVIVYDWIREILLTVLPLIAICFLNTQIILKFRQMMRKKRQMGGGGTGAILGSKTDRGMSETVLTSATSNNNNNLGKRMNSTMGNLQQSSQVEEGPHKSATESGLTSNPQKYGNQGMMQVFQQEEKRGWSNTLGFCPILCRVLRRSITSSYGKSTASSALTSALIGKNRSTRRRVRKSTIDTTTDISGMFDCAGRSTADYHNLHPSFGGTVSTSAGTNNIRAPKTPQILVNGVNGFGVNDHQQIPPSTESDHIVFKIDEASTQSSSNIVDNTTDNSTDQGFPNQSKTFDNNEANDSSQVANNLRNIFLSPSAGNSNFDSNEHNSLKVSNQQTLMPRLERVSSNLSTAPSQNSVEDQLFKDDDKDGPSQLEGRSGAKIIWQNFCQRLCGVFHGRHSMRKSLWPDELSTQTLAQRRKKAKYERDEKRLTTMLIAVAIQYFICCVPQAVTALVDNPQLRQLSAFRMVIIVTNVLEALNYMLNFYVYLLFVQDFPKHTKKSFQTLFGCGRRNRLRRQNMR